MTPAPTHRLFYGKSRVGKTTVAAHFAKAGMKLLVVTREPGPAAAALEAQGATAPILVPQTPEELFVLLEYTKAYLDRHMEGLSPDLVLFDNLQGIQQLIIGESAEKAREIAGVQIPERKATGILRRGGNPASEGAITLADYNTLAHETARFLRAVDQMEMSTIITAGSAFEFDEKYREEAKGLDAKAAAGRSRRVEGAVAVEGKKILSYLPHLVSGAFVHMVKEDGRFIMHTQTHKDANGVEWFADPRGLNPQLPAKIDWTNKSAYDILVANGR